LGLLLLLVASALPARADEGAIDVSDRPPLAFVLNTPTGAAARTRTSDLIRLIDDVTRASTGLKLETVDESVTKGCRGRLLCVVMRIRTDYDREALREPSGRFRPYYDHLAELRGRNVVYPKLLLFITNITRDGEPDRLSAQLIDTDIALEAYHSALREGEDWEANVEALANEKAVSTPRTEVESSAGAAAFVKALFSEHLRASFVEHKVWEPFGRLDLTAAIPGLELRLDGTSIGVTQPGNVTHVTGVLPGKHELRIDGPDIRPFVATIEVVKGQTLALDTALDVRPTQTTRVAQTMTFVAGAAAIVGGGVVTVLAIATPSGDAGGVCYRGVQASCETGQELLRSSYDSGRFNDQNGGGVLLAPLGYSLVAGGATWMLGTWLYTDGDDVPWIPLVAGVAVGALSYGISAALNPSLYAEPAR